MKFAILSLLPLLIAASAIGDRDATIMSNELPTIDVKDLPAGSKLGVVELKTSNDKEEFSAAAYCPPGYPKYCPAYKFCCPEAAVACCPRACCGRGTIRCGSDGLCYR
ncbi:hypothetical protein IF1G_00918 [Cordyceps javanica]|uniref:Uncharacterized protein n=1 Tax=Cordyceps javanica TaxID=43265 RepID=A0A545WDV0_9HYPO|nr:hypothetical protein IF1G_00918 [Cordyceps javanica]TQW12150.1 hypothetical protein IF2G_00881 [Cordyceps javanica]